MTKTHIYVTGMAYICYRDGINRITEILRDDIEPQSIHPHNIDARTKILCALRFYATGSMQGVVGDTVGVSQKSVSR